MAAEGEGRPETTTVLGAQDWVTVLADGTPPPYRAAPGALCEVTISNASLVIDTLRLRESVGEPIRLNGPRAVLGVLRRVEVDQDADQAVLWIDTAADDLFARDLRGQPVGP